MGQRNKKYKMFPKLNYKKYKMFPKLNYKKYKKRSAGFSVGLKKKEKDKIIKKKKIKL